MTRRRATRLAIGAAAVLAVAIACWIGRRDVAPAEWISLSRPPRIRPDYRETVIPPNIAPLNFVVEEPGTAYYVRIDADEGRPIAVHSSDGGIRIPLRPWKTLLSQNRGRKLNVEVYASGQDRRWQRFAAFSWAVAEEEIDPYLVYRLLDPTFNTYQNLGIYQRNLEAHDESPVLFNASFGRGCVNCHAFANNRPDPLLLHVRGGADESIAGGMIVVRGGRAARVSTRTKTSLKPAGFTAWHPSGHVAAFSVNNTVQYMHGMGRETREVYERDSHLAILDFRTGEVSTPPAIADPARFATFPCWSPDGNYLYYCGTQNVWEKIKDSLLKDYPKVKYDLMRISYDLAANRWGKPEVFLAAATTGKSVVEPRASPDGRYLLFCMCDHGSFPAFREDSDLYLMDMADRSYRRLEASSPRSESWHCWSSNSRWIVFESRRDNDLLAWPYLCYVDRAGQDHKPFLLPQADPRFYDTRLKTYNLPELITGRITVSEKELVRALRTESSDAEASDAYTAHE